MKGTIKNYRNLSRIRLLIYVISASFLILLLVINNYIASNIFPTFYGSDSMKPIDFYIGKTGTIHLRIPRAYIEFLPEDNGGNPFSIFIEAFLPDMLPMGEFKKLHPIPPTGDLKIGAEYQKNWLSIEIQSTFNKGRLGLSDIISNYRTTYRRNPAKDFSEYIAYDNIPLPGSVYIGKTYIHNGDEKYISCNLDEGKYSICTIDFYIYDDRIRILCDMRPENIYRAQYVIDSITKFLLPKVNASKE